MIRSGAASGNASTGIELAARNCKVHATVVLPAGTGGRIADLQLRRWLSRGRLTYREQEREILLTVLEQLGHTAKGLAALRLWGQTGERSAAWMAAADPVFLEARLDHVRLHALSGRSLPMSDMRPLFDFLQDSFGSDELAFARIGRYAYLRGDASISSADVSSKIVDGMPPDKFMPDGPAAASHHRLLSEVQMALHEHSVNLYRQNAGDRPMNSIWIWGGGRAPPQAAKPIPALFSNDPLFKGYWYSCTGVAEPWHDDIARCLEIAENGFVAVAPERAGADGNALLDNSLRQLKALLTTKKIDSLTLLFRDGLQVDIGRLDRFRFWRRESSQLMPA